jgi:hypothetical protein
LTSCVDLARPVLEHECEQELFENGLPTYVDVVKYLEKQLLIGDSAKLMGVIRDEHLPAVDPPAATGGATGQEAPGSDEDGEAGSEDEGEAGGEDEGDPQWLEDTLNFFAEGEDEGGLKVIDADATSSTGELFTSHMSTLARSRRQLSGSYHILLPHEPTRLSSCASHVIPDSI